MESKKSKRHEAEARATMSPERWKELQAKKRKIEDEWKQEQPEEEMPEVLTEEWEKKLNDERDRLGIPHLGASTKEWEEYTRKSEERLKSILSPAIWEDYLEKKRQRAEEWERQKPLWEEARRRKEEERRQKQRARDRVNKAWETLFAVYFVPMIMAFSHLMMRFGINIFQEGDSIADHIKGIGYILLCCAFVGLPLIPIFPRVEKLIKEKPTIVTLLYRLNIAGRWIGLSAFMSVASLIALLVLFYFVFGLEGLITALAPNVFGQIAAAILCGLVMLATFFASLYGGAPEPRRITRERNKFETQASKVLTIYFILFALAIAVCKIATMYISPIFLMVYLWGVPFWAVWLICREIWTKASLIGDGCKVVILDLLRQEITDEEDERILRAFESVKEILCKENMTISDWKAAIKLHKELNTLETKEIEDRLHRMGVLTNPHNRPFLKARVYPGGKNLEEALTLAVWQARKKKEEIFEIGAKADQVSAQADRDTATDLNQARDAIRREEFGEPEPIEQIPWELDKLGGLAILSYQSRKCIGILFDSDPGVYTVTVEGKTPEANGAGSIKSILTVNGHPAALQFPAPVASGMIRVQRGDTVELITLS